MNQLPVEIRVSLSKKFPPGVSEVKFGIYLLRVIPSEISDGSEAILQFNNAYSHPEGGGSHPEEEAINICRLLSLFLNVRTGRWGSGLTIWIFRHNTNTNNI